MIRPLLAAALFAFASIAQAAPLRLVAPANGTTLRGGTFAELRWSATQLPDAAEEWEAFLSVDGGKYYAFRVTPHLDIELRRFTFVVPNVDTRDARILIRAGNELRETHFEPQGSFAIERDPNAEVVVPAVLHFGRGEAAREGDQPVLTWADSTRSGFGLTQRSAAPMPSHAVDRIEVAPGESEPLLPPAVNRVTAPFIAQTRQPAAKSQARRSEPLPLSVDLLLVCRRRNI